MTEYFARSDENFGGSKEWGCGQNFRRATVFCLEYRLTKHKMTTYAKSFGRACPPCGYFYVRACWFCLNFNMCGPKWEARCSVYTVLCFIVYSVISNPHSSSVPWRPLLHFLCDFLILCLFPPVLTIYCFVSEFSCRDKDLRRTRPNSFSKVIRLPKICSSD